MTDALSPDRDGDLVARLGRALAPAYEMDGEIGRGGMAIVYRARDARLKRRRRHQAAAARARVPRRHPLALSSRSRDGGAAQPSEHRPDLHRRRARRARVLRHGVRRRAEASATGSRRRRAADRRDAAHSARSGRRASVCASRGRRPSRHQAGQHSARRASRAARWSPTSASRARRATTATVAAHGDGRGDRHAGVHVARAMRRRARDRWTHRSLLARHRGVSDARRRAAVRRRQHAVDHDASRSPSVRCRCGAPRRCAGRSRAHRHETSRKGPGNRFPTGQALVAALDGAPVTPIAAPAPSASTSPSVGAVADQTVAEQVAAAKARIIEKRAQLNRQSVAISNMFPFVAPLVDRLERLDQNLQRGEVPQGRAARREARREAEVSAMKRMTTPSLFPTGYVVSKTLRRVSRRRAFFCLASTL